MRNAEEHKMDGSFALVMRPRWDLRDGYIRKFERKRIRKEAHRSLMMICAEAVAAAGPPSSQKRDGCCQKLETVHQCIPIPIQTYKKVSKKIQSRCNSQISHNLKCCKLKKNIVKNIRTIRTIHSHLIAY